MDKISCLKELHFTRKPHTIKYTYFQVFISCLYMHSCLDMYWPEFYSHVKSKLGKMLTD